MTKLISIDFCINNFMKFLWGGHLARPDHATQILVSLVTGNK